MPPLRGGLHADEDSAGYKATVIAVGGMHRVFSDLIFLLLEDDRDEVPPVWIMGITGGTRADIRPEAHAGTCPGMSMEPPPPGGLVGLLGPARRGGSMKNVYY